MLMLRHDYAMPLMLMPFSLLSAASLFFAASLMPFSSIRHARLPDYYYAIDG